MQGLTDALSKAKEVALDAAHTVQDAAAQGKETATDWTATVADTLNRKHAAVKEYAEKWMKIKVRDFIFDMVASIPKRLREGSEDKDMPRCIARAKDRLIDGIWPDFQEEIMWEISVLLDEDVEEYNKVELAPGPDCVRAFLRYHIAPYDKTMWASLKDPVYLIIFLLSCIPTYGIFAWTYLVIFFVLDKSDEFQLIYFILWFKGSQFFSWGVIKSFVGYFQYFYCATFPVSIQDSVVGGSVARKGADSCEKFGPGMSTNYLFTVLSWVAMLVFCWLAWFLLRFSEEKGRSKVKGKLNAASLSGASLPAQTVGSSVSSGGSEVVTQEQEAPEVLKEEKGMNSHGYIAAALIWDASFFVFSVGLLFLIVFIQPNEEDVTGVNGNSTGSRGRDSAEDIANSALLDVSWQVKQTLYLCQVIYGWSSIVFVPFMLPFLQNVLTHAPPTAYDRKGRCRKFKKPDPPKKEEGEDAPLNFFQKVFSDAEVEKFFSQMKDVAAGHKVDLEGLRERAKKVTEAATGAPKAPDVERPQESL